MGKYMKVKSITKIGKEPIFSIQNNEKDLYKDQPNFFTEGCLSKNSKHACVHKDSLVSTQRGKVPISKLEENDKIAYLDSNHEIKLTKKYDLINTGRKKLFKVKLKDGKELIITEEHELFNKFEGESESTKLKKLKVGDEIVVF